MKWKCWSTFEYSFLWASVRDSQTSDPWHNRKIDQKLLQCSLNHTQWCQCLLFYNRLPWFALCRTFFIANPQISLFLFFGTVSNIQQIKLWMNMCCHYQSGFQPCCLYSAYRVIMLISVHSSPSIFIACLNECLGQSGSSSVRPRHAPALSSWSRGAEGESVSGVLETSHSGDTQHITEC